MWFDARAKLAEIVGDTPATTATTATRAELARPVSRLSRAPEAKKLAVGVAEVATVATPLPETCGRTMDGIEAETRFPHAYSALGRPITWTGLVVSLADWRNLTEWERHGPDGRHRNGITRKWEPAETN